MAISSYPRTIKNGQIASNGDANAGTGLMLWDSATNTYIAATPATFGGAAAGGATAALQTTLNNIVSTKALQTSQAAALAAETNGGILVDTFSTQILTTSMVALSTSQACKTVTLINLSTNAKLTYCISGGTALSLEAGYSVKINVGNSSNVQIRQSTGEGQTCEIIITA
jgi:hypothetical protein